MGLFLAALLAGALASLSSGLNALAAVLWEDFLAHTDWAHASSEKMVRRPFLIFCKTVKNV